MTGLQELQLNEFDLATFDTLASSLTEKRAWIAAAIRVGALIVLRDKMDNTGDATLKTLP